MVKVDELELELMEEGKYENYSGCIGKRNDFDPVKYAMAMARTAEEFSQKDSLMFVGGIGVFGVLFDHVGEEIVERGIRKPHDVDLMIATPDGRYIVEQPFEELDVSCKSLSIRNKHTIRGRSSDLEGRPLESLAVDVYYPGGDPTKGIRFQGRTINNEVWDRSLEVSVFGVPFRVMHPSDLLSLKLAVKCDKKGVRDQDCQDVYHLLASLQQRGYSPEEITSQLYKRERRNLVRALNGAQNPSSFKKVLYLNPDYVEALTE